MLIEATCSFSLLQVPVVGRLTWKHLTRRGKNTGEPCTFPMQNHGIPVFFPDYMGNLLFGVKTTKKMPKEPGRDRTAK